MKQKELKQMAQKIAKLERIIQANEDSEEVKKAQKQIMELSGRVKSLDDICMIDEMVQTLLEE